MTAATCDPRALSVAQAVHQREQPLATILFGSRARGDYEERRSDIDIMLLQHEIPDWEMQWPITEWVAAIVQETYGRDVPVQLLWRTPDQFRYLRRYVNSVETRAARDGVFMSQDPNWRDTVRYAGEATECEYDWSIYDNRMRYAESNLTAFEDTIDLGSPDLIVGYHAQAALKYALKALLESHGAICRSAYDVAYILDCIRRIDPKMRDFNFSLPPDIYTEYDWASDYGLPRRHPSLTDQPDYRARTVADAQRIINRARAVRQSRDD